jgi:amino acid adenylation domain-containing protein
VDGLSPAKQALLEKWARGGAGSGRAIRARNAGSEASPLSFVQERQLFLELLDPNTAVNNLCICVRIDGWLDLARLELSANRLLARHDVLRTTFDLDHGRAVARIAPAVDIGLEVVDLQDRADERLTEALRLAEREAGHPFALDRPPLLRVRMFRLAPDAHVMLVVVHHTIADGWSLGVFLRELFAVYEALRERPNAELAPLPIQYADYAAWQRESLRGASIERPLRYWKRQLDGELPVLELPTDRPRPARQTFAGKCHRIHLPADLARDLKTLSRRQDATPFMTLVAAFQTLLHRWCGEDDILVGTPTAGRTLPETEELIGAFINTLVLRTTLSGNPSFADLLARVRAVALAAYAHQELPFEKLVAELKPQRDLSRTPIFQVLFILQNTPLPSLHVPGLSLSLLPVDRGAAQFDLTLSVTEVADGLDAAFEYNSDLFDASTIERLAGGFRLLLADAVAHPAKPISQLALMSDAERHYLVRGLNQTGVDYPRERCTHQLFEEQAARTPEAVAVACGAERVTYGELDRRASALAADLQDLGVGPDVPVGVCLERSLELVTALLAVHKAGGAYLPIEPATPQERIAFMLRDASARLLLTDRSLAKGVSSGVVARPLNGAPSSSGDRAAAGPRPGVTAGSLAYVIYTSGSTGLPKGVLVRHRALANVLWAMQRLLELGGHDTLLAVTSVSFDIAALELFLPLIAGATVVLATRDMTLDRRKLQDALVRHGVTIMQATPAMWRMMLQGDWPGDPELVALCGGEPLTPDLAERLLDRVGRLWNVYGPTETTVWSCAGKVRRGQRPITVGRPIANTQLYVLDHHLQPVPTGATGELYIGGDGVALGYLNRPELTAEKFLPNPFADGPGTDARLFRTGDRARYRADGSVELLGRLDDQVKIHGFRVELGEVESVLSRHSAVRQVAVVARQHAAGGRSLVAYFVPVRMPPPTAAELRTFLREVLPAYMVPAVFVPLAELPLTRSGKVDRCALPVAAPSPVSPPFVAPRSQLEERLAGTYAQVLGVERVGIHDNFFDLGGGSIQILEIIVRAQADGLILKPELFFEHQTVAELATFLSARAP